MRVFRVLRNSTALLLALVVLVIAYLYVPNLAAFNTICGNFIRQVLGDTNSEIKVPDRKESAGLQQDNIPLEGENGKPDEGGTSEPGSAGDDISGDGLRSGDEGDTGADADSYFLTYDEMLNIENISLRDKLAGLSIIRKIPGRDISRIMDMADGGITLDEAGELEAILKQNLDSDDIDKLKEILDRNRKLYALGKLASK